MILQVSSEAKKDGPFFTIIGLICGITQYLSYNYFDKAQLGSELLQEHIAFHTLVLMIIFLWLCSALLRWKAEFFLRDYLDKLVNHLSGRAVAFALVATFVIIGFGLAAIFFQSYENAVKLFFVSLYFLALAEIAVSPKFHETKSLCYWPAMSIVISTPFTFK